MAEYSRPASAERFRFDGMKTNAVPDSLPAHKYPYAQNIRGTNEDSIQSRPQLVQNVAAVSAPITAMEPSGGITKQGSILTSFATAAQIDTGYDLSQGASIIPYRPNATPNLWDYVFDDNKLTKVNIQAGPVVLVQKTGIAEPQTAPDAVPSVYLLTDFTAAAASWAATGTAGALADTNRTSEAIVALRGDPSVFGQVQRFSAQVGTGTSYGIMEELIDTTLSATSAQVILDIIPPFNPTTNNTIGAIFYFSGNTGHCIIVPSLSGASELLVSGVTGKSVFSVEQIANLRRGALLSINAAETVVVWSVIVGPGNQICIETFTIINHAAGESIKGVPALVIGGGGFWSTGDTIVSKVITSQVTVGVGLITQTLASNPFTNKLTQIQNASTGSGNTPQQADLLHMSFNVDTLANLTEIKILFDIGDGSFTQNFYYKTIRPSDIQTAIANTSTQLAAAQIAAQRAIIDAAVADAIGNQQDTGSSLQTVAGSTQWTEITFPISDLTKIGGDDTKTLSNVNAVQLAVIASGTVNIQFGGLYVGGGGNIDVGDTANPIFYRVRPRSSLTGAYGNPSPVTRYGVSPRRQSVLLSLPSAAYDTQIDTWDIERQGGTILGDPATNDSGWRYVGSTPSVNASYTDIIDDLSITRSYTRNIVDYEPFPGIGPPITALTSTITGVIMIAAFQTAAVNTAAAATLKQLASLLPGNLFNIGFNLFTLKRRPIFVSSGVGTQTYQFEFVENAGSQSNPFVLLQEPLLAGQTTNNVFGPDANGILFAVQVGTAVTTKTSGLRPGVVQTTNANNPDSADEANTSEIIAPNEPLINGVMLGSTPFVASSNNWWRGFEKADQSGRIRYSWNRQQVGKGLAAPFGICSDGKYIYFVSKNGIDRHAAGASESLTDEDLYNLFPHEGIFGQNVTYLGKTVFAPEYEFAEAFRLNVVNNFLYFDYLDSTQGYRTLVCDLRRMVWSVDLVGDVAFPQMTIHVGTGAPSSNDLLPASAVKNQQLFIGGTNGAVYIEASPAFSFGEKVSCVIATREDMLGDIRSRKIFGDIALDCLPVNVITVTPVLFHSLFATPTSIPQGSRPDIPFNISLSGEQKDRSIGLLLTWMDQGLSTVLYSWQPSYLTQPEDIVTRFTDWSNANSQGNKFWQGFNIEIDTLNVSKSIKVRDADSQGFHDFTSPVGINLIKGNGQQVISCSFVTPFLAHLCRLEPQDLNVFSIFKMDWVTQAAPSGALTWITQASNFGLDGYIHLGPELLACYASTQPVTLTITAFDGLSPSAIVMPSTGGLVQKVSFPLSPSKGLLYTFSGVSTAPWFPYLDSWEILIKSWGSPGPYQRIKPIGGNFGDSARI